MADREFHANDTWPPLEYTLTDKNGPIDLSPADSVQMIMTGPAGTLTANVFIDPDQSTYRGKVTYFWQIGDTDTPGTYQFLFRIVWSPTQEQRVPSIGWRSIVIEPD